MVHVNSSVFFALDTFFLVLTNCRLLWSEYLWSVFLIECDWFGDGDCEVKKWHQLNEFVLDTIDIT